MSKPKSKPKIKLLELFCGTKSIGKEFSKFDCEIVSLDMERRFDPTICANILSLSNTEFCGQGFTHVWASPPCNAFSVCRIGHNWTDDHQPKNATARLGHAILKKTVAIIEALRTENPDLKFWMENPVGKMRRMPEVQSYKNYTITYCRYGDTRMKPTDIWTNTHWIPRQRCDQGDPCHEKAPRGSKTGGVQGQKNAEDRAVIPPEFCREIAEFVFLGKNENKPWLVKTWNKERPAHIRAIEAELFQHSLFELFESYDQ